MWKWIGAVALGVAGSAALADEPIGGYVAVISAQDVVNSRGIRLNDAAAILRQDRANVHRFGKIDAQDEIDQWFWRPEARAVMGDLIAAKGGIPDYAVPLILRGNAYLYVTVWAQNGQFTGLTVDVPG